ALEAYNYVEYPTVVERVSMAPSIDDQMSHLPTPVILKVNAWDIGDTDHIGDPLKKSAVVWALVGKRQAHYGWKPELGILTRAGRVEITDRPAAAPPAARLVRGRRRPGRPRGRPIRRHLAPLNRTEHLRPRLAHGRLPRPHPRPHGGLWVAPP